MEVSDVLGFLSHSGVSGLNSLLLVAVFLIVRAKFSAMEDKLNTLWDWHMVQRGREKERAITEEE